MFRSQTRVTDGGVSEYELFIDGEFTASTSDERLDVEYPYTGEVWASTPNGSTEDIDDAVAAARTAFEHGPWRNMRPSQRRSTLHQIADVLDTHSDELGELETRQNGKLIREMSAQASGLGTMFRYYAGFCDKIEGDVIPVENKDGQMFNYTRKEPLGVVGAITPWNSPLTLTVFKIAPALATGNTVVHKPSEYTPVSALRLGELIKEETDLPDGVYNVVPGDGKTGAALADHGDVDKLAFTGSSATGREVAKKAGEKIIPVTLELGGKSANIVFRSANTENVVNGIVKGIFAASGQTCLAGSRVFIQDDVYDDVVNRLTERASEIELGDPMDPETEMGPLAFRGQWEKAKKYINLGTAEGATLAIGGAPSDDSLGEYFIRPTVLTDVNNDMQVAQEEIFGPVASVMSFSDEDEVVELANESNYGLVAGVWTENMRQAHRMIDQLDVGSVFINEYRTVSYASPYGGYKDSGLGRENGREGLEEYLQTKSVWFDLSGSVADPFSLT